MVAIIALAILVTSFISGILGMAGGIILMGGLSMLLPVTSTMILHGITQMGSNGFRAFLLREHIQWSVLWRYLIGAILGFALFSLLAFVPSKSMVLITIGLFPILAMVMPKRINLDLMRPRNTYLGGFVVTCAQITAGVSGPLLDVFFIKSSLNRFEIIATKAMTQTVGHLLKLVYYGKVLLFMQNEGLAFPLYVIPLALAVAAIGTRLGRQVLERLSEIQFRRYSRIVIAVIGLFYVWRGIFY